MKNFTAILVVLLFAIGVVACGKKGGLEAPDRSTSAQAN